MIALVGGLSAAVCEVWATLTAALATKLIGSPSVLAWVMLVGFVIAAPLAGRAGVPNERAREGFRWLAVAGAGNVGGLLPGVWALRIRPGLGSLLRSARRRARSPR